ncbi:hypothetical protein EVAR_41106_1 [Eumeta japonica]|uniref:Uncharacterized protein n=1 Tax=Eumeta variegata TaxID=151549 RepID=A0A4C1XEU7_EUMVA|nr:hypothetical protein EVAR_41106_1 [Eumeta japonica]
MARRTDITKKTAKIESEDPKASKSNENVIFKNWKHENSYFPRKRIVKPTKRPLMGESHIQKFGVKIIGPNEPDRRKTCIRLWLKYSFDFKSGQTRRGFVGDEYRLPILRPSQRQLYDRRASVQRSILQNTHRSYSAPWNFMTLRHRFDVARGNEQYDIRRDPPTEPPGAVPDTKGDLCHIWPT